MVKIILLFLTISFTSISYAQSPDSDINSVRLEYKKIRSNLKSYTSQFLDVMNESTEGGKGIAYYNNNDLKLIEITLFGENGKNIVEYYFKNETLFFVFSQRYNYNMPIYIDEKTAKGSGFDAAFDINKSNITENRYYFKNNEIFLWIDNEKNEVNLGLNDNINEIKYHINFSNRLKTKLKS